MTNQKGKVSLTSGKCDLEEDVVARTMI